MIGIRNSWMWIIFSLCAFNVSAAELAETIRDCEACHGANGISQESDVPTIAGMSFVYLNEAMISYQDATRPCPETDYRDGSKEGKTDMCKIATPLSDPDIEKIAEHYSSLSFEAAKQPFDAAKAEQGQKIHDLLCEKCHADGGRDAADDAGILAGQWMPYLDANMADYRSGARPMIDKMAKKFEKLNDEYVDALLHFYASQQ